jgi:hypothetical protein
MLISDLDQARRRGDEPADRIVSDMGGRAWALSALLAPVRSREDLRPPGVSDAVWDLVVPPLPSFADPHRLRAAQTFADRNLPAITVALFCASLPASYGDREGARLLAATGRMQRDLDRRINETARFVFDVLRPNGFDPGGRAPVSIGKVRIVHASVRATAKHQPQSDEALINQEQMLGTLCLFSVVVLDALERLGVLVDPRDAEDYVHLWCVTGALLGIEPGLLPASRKEASALFAELKRRRFQPSEEGRALLEDLLVAMERHMAIFGMRELPRRMVRHLLGTEQAQRLGVEAAEHDLPRIPLLGAPLLRSWSNVTSVRPPALAPRFGRVLLETVNALKLGSRPAALPMRAPTEVPPRCRAR